MTKFIFFSAVASLLAQVFFTSYTFAAVTGFDAGRIIDDSVFTNKSSLSAGQIQEFLNGKVPNCDTNGTQPYGGTTRAAYSASKGISTPFTCIKDYSENGRTAAQIIYDVAQKYSINPQVLIVLLQKEQGLITDDWPWPVQYRSATGYGCPDTAACDSQYYGLTNQLDWAAKMFRSIMNNSPSWYTPYVLGNNFLRYSPDASCGGGNVYVQNRSTQALYNYTPYQPNAGALAADWGTAPCGAYGNRNFYLYFTSWFGSTSANPVRTWESAGQQVNYGVSATDSGYVGIKPNQTVTLTIKAKNTGNQTWNKFNTYVGASRPNDRVSEFANGTWINARRPAQMQEESVIPGGIATFTFSITAPNKIFSSQEYFNVVTEGVSWQNDIGYYYLVDVAPPAGEYYNANITADGLFKDAARTQNLSESYNNVVTGSNIYGRTVVKNTGNSPLSTTNTFLASTSPRDRLSLFYDTSWPSTNRIAPVPSVVNTNESTTINYVLKAPSQTGYYTETFGLVVEGKSWIDYDKVSYGINVVNQPQVALTANQPMTANTELGNTKLTHRLIVQDDGNLVLYRGNTPTWSSNTRGASEPTLIMQSDGNLVLYSKGGRAVWSSGTASGLNSMLRLQEDGNLVVYAAGNSARWATNTN